jgi:hypothetical protein
VSDPHIEYEVGIVPVWKTVTSLVFGPVGPMDWGGRTTAVMDYFT